MIDYRFTRKKGKTGTPLSIESSFHTMKRDGVCFGCGTPLHRGRKIYRISMLAGKQPYINLCGECQEKIVSDITNEHDRHK